MITCRELIDFLGQHLDGELSPGEQAEFDRHLAVCPACRSYLESYRETIRLGKAACSSPEDRPPDDIPEDLVKAILAARRKAR
jgi:anti-sigma factor RsiW